MIFSHPTLPSKRTLVIATSLLLTASIAEARLVNYGDQNLDCIKEGFNQGNLHILQIGDSHTAGDYFTEQLRKRLQADIGDGGIGFAYPDKIKGQRVARHGYKSSWNTDNSRFNQSGGNYPIGGIKATARSNNDRLTLTSRYYAHDTQSASIVVHGRKGQRLTLKNAHGNSNIRLKQNGWQSVQGSINFPTTISADRNVSIGGFWLKRPKGGLVSAMGINGATQDYWNRWRSDLSKSLSFSNADIVVLAYGTNEAFKGNANSLTRDMNAAIKDIRRGLPHAAILILGAPESLKGTAGQCGRRAPSLNSVQSQLQRIAQDNQTLYWSWQEAMGGRCSMKSWVNQRLAARDGVHFSRGGYNRAANSLYNDLNSLLRSAQSGQPKLTNSYTGSTFRPSQNQTQNYTGSTFRPSQNQTQNYTGSTFRPTYINSHDLDDSIYDDLIENNSSNNVNSSIYNEIFSEGLPKSSDFTD